MISTTTTVTSSANPSNLGSSVTFTGTVTSAGGPNMSGTVAFFAGGIYVGTGNIVMSGGGGGYALFSISTLLGGNTPIIAVYSGDANYSTSTSAAFTQTVNKRTPSIGVSSSGTPSVYGQPVTFTASGDQTGPADLPAPTGTITFLNGAASMGTAPFVPVGGKTSSAALPVSNLAVGASQSITASYPGDSNYNSSTSNAWSQTVNKANTTTTLTSSVNPSALCQGIVFTARVRAASPGSGTPTGTVTFTIDGTPGSPISLSGGGASTSTITNLSQADHTVSAAYNGDSNFNTSTSDTLTQTVTAAVDWALTAAATIPDPQQGHTIAIGTASVSTKDGGLVAPTAEIDANQSTECDCGCECKEDDVEAGLTPNVLAYSARTLNVKPIISAILATDYCSAVPSQIQVQLTFNGTPEATVTYNTTGHSAGDVYHLPMQVSSAVSSSGIYDWSVQAWVTVGGTVYNRSASGTLPVVVNTSSPFGAGFGLGGVWSLLIGSAGAAIADGFGGTRYFTGTPGSLPFTYTSPANDQGTLVKNANGTYTYTAKSQLKTNFNSSGQQTSQVDLNGLTQTLGQSTKLDTITQPDGGVATLGYTSNLLTSVTMPGGRLLTLSYTGTDLTGIVDAAGGLRTLAYDGSHRLTNEKVGPLNTTYGYATDNFLRSIDRGLGTITTIVAAAVQGLGASTAINASQAVGAVTDPLGNITSSTLDSSGRLTQLQTADGALQTWTLNTAGNPTAYTDQLARTTTNTFDASEDLTQIEFPDGTLRTMQYDSTFHKVKQIQDELGRFTTLGYDATTGDLLTVKDALGNVTTNTWSNGLKQTTKDPLGRVTTLLWDTSKRRETAMQDALGNFTTFGYDTAGNQITVRDALNRVTTTAFDGGRRIVSRTNALGGIATNAYDPAGFLTSSIDELGRSTSYGYDQRGLQVTRMDAVGTAVQRTTTTAYDTATNVLSVTDPLADITSFGYDVLNRQTRRIEAYGTGIQRTTTTNYDAVSNALSTVDARGTTTSFGYDLRNRQTQRIEAFGNALQRTTTTSFDAVGNVFNVTDPNGTVTSFGYDDLNRQTLRVDAYGISGLGRTTTTAFDAVGNTLSVTNAIAVVTSFGYDALNRRTRAIEAFGEALARTTTTNFDAVSNAVSTVNPRGTVTSFALDALNRRVNQYDDYGGSLQRTLTMAYDAVSNLLSATNGRNVTTSFGYDPLNRRVMQTDAYGTSLARTATTVFDAADNAIASIDALGYATTSGYDALNRRITVKNPDGGVATTAYDAVDNVVNTINQLGNTTTFGYDVLNRRTTTTDARNAVVTLAYDPNNNLLSLTDPVGNQTQWLYDALNRKVQETDPLFNRGTFAYDAIDRMTWATDKLAQKVAFAYDVLNRETGETWYNAGGSQVNLLTFTFDPNSNLLTAQNNAGIVTLTHDALDRLATAKDVFGTLVTYTRDAADNNTVTQDSFGGIVTRTFDALNRATTMQFTGQSATLREDFAYSVRDQVSNQTRYSNLAGTTLVGSSTMGYDSVMRMTRLQHLDSSSANIANYTNTYDLASRITAEILNGGNPTTFQYDAIDEVTSDAAVSYSYDLNGNRTMTGYTTGSNNQITSDGTWNFYADKNGNIVEKSKSGEVWSFGFDNRNRMIAAQDVTSAGLQMIATYTQDALGQRVQKAVTSGGSTTTTRFAFDDTRQIFADLDGSNALQTRYLLGNSILERLSVITSGGTVSWLLPDYLGSVRNVVNGSGVLSNTLVYDAFGNIVSESNPGVGGLYRWVSYRIDPETGFLRADMSWRFYEPATGRWLTVDPIGILGGDANLWRYTLNNPTNSIDPDGLQGFSLVDDPASLPGVCAGAVGGGLVYQQIRAWKVLFLTYQRHLAIEGLASYPLTVALQRAAVAQLNAYLATLGAIGNRWTAPIWAFALRQSSLEISITGDFNDVLNQYLISVLRFYANESDDMIRRAIEEELLEIVLARQSCERAIKANKYENERHKQYCHAFMRFSEAIKDRLSDTPSFYYCHTCDLRAEDQERLYGRIRDFERLIGAGKGALSREAVAAKNSLIDSIEKDPQIATCLRASRYIQRLRKTNPALDRQIDILIR